MAIAKGKIDVKFTPAARARLEAFIASIDSPGATICLMKGRVSGEHFDWWRYNYYDDWNIPKVTEMLAPLGRPLLYDCDGLTIALPQFQLIPELEGKTLALGENNSLVVRD